MSINSIQIGYLPAGVHTLPSGRLDECDFCLTCQGTVDGRYIIPCNTCNIKKVCCQKCFTFAKPRKKGKYQSNILCVVCTRDKKIDICLR